MCPTNLTLVDKRNQDSTALSRARLCAIGGSRGLPACDRGAAARDSKVYAAIVAAGNNPTESYLLVFPAKIL